MDGMKVRRDQLRNPAPSARITTDGILLRGLCGSIRRRVPRVSRCSRPGNSITSTVCSQVRSCRGAGDNFPGSDASYFPRSRKARDLGHPPICYIACFHPVPHGGL